MTLMDADVIREIAALVVALCASMFWVSALLQGIVWDAGRTGIARIAPTATAFAAFAMLAQIAYAIAWTTCLP